MTTERPVPALGPQPLDPGIVGYRSPTTERQWDNLATILYSLGIGAGDDGGDSELAFTTESSIGVDQKVFPTFGVIPGTGRPAVAGFRGIDLARITHRGHSLTCHDSIPPAGRAICASTIDTVFDTGDDAIICVTTTSLDPETGRLIWTNNQTLHVRGAGGFDGSPPPDRSTAVVTGRQPDHRVAYRTRPNQALLYRLTGDLNPLHSDPEFASRAGFRRPILHGLCTFGFAGRALLHRVCESDPDRFGGLSARFVRPVFPGQTLRVSIWIDDTVRFTVENEEGKLVLADGRFWWR